MPVGINQPSNQIKFTNVSLVRLRKAKKRFELACYKNKLLDFRSGAETNLDNVLQVPTVFLSVSKGQTAPTAELAKAFGAKATQQEIIQEILQKGEIQVGERERKEVVDRMEKEVLELVSARLVDPTTKRVYTTGMISKALDQIMAASGHQTGGAGGKGKSSDGSAGADSRRGSVVSAGSIPNPEEEAVEKKPLWNGVVTTKSAKSQALEAMKALIAWQPIPVMRARMRLRITCPTSILKQAARVAPAAPTHTESKSKSKGHKKGKKGGQETSHAEDDDHEAAAPQKASGTVKDRILGYFELIESQDVLGSDEWEVLGFAEPGAFKGLSEFVGGETKGLGRVEVLDMAVTHEED